ncbi:RNA ligase family protein [Mangrovihabitans endophyticus]|uniref:2'-5' RNA ligase n=1 Tax=Mangrovihabitans endophyticus TaxID=1751298 RepID=A0A8J3C219_9ACTN|nr:RNA ligase family protein [Mangrovihabitans endophyticus]GGK99331.1 2'-5' RNA ligase [Mangrovihabitans endophyticus]
MRHPRAPHLPDSPGAGPDAAVQRDLSWLDGELVVTEKLDGHALIFTRDALVVPDEGGDLRPWDLPAKALWAMTAHRVPDDWRVCGASMWARHGIAYTDLPGAFIVFDIWDETDTLLGWDDTVDWARRLELPVVPVLYRGGSISEARRAWARTRDGRCSEGFILRSAGRVSAADFEHRVVQWVRAGHVPAGDRRMPDDFAVNGFA